MNRPAAHLTGELFKMTTGAQWAWFPTKGPSSPQRLDRRARRPDIHPVFPAFTDLHMDERSPAIAAKVGQNPAPDIPMKKWVTPTSRFNTWT
jgi:hypothetical protein